jgi:HK97 family phage prohead protease
MTNDFTKSSSFSVEHGNEGEITAYITTWGNPDVVDDVMAKGCCDKWLEDFAKNDEKLPMLHGHSSMDVVGEWVSFESDDYGLKATGILYTEVTAASDLHKLIKRGAIASVSIGFRSTDYDNLDNGGRKFNEIQLMETSVVLNPANPKAKILSVKSEDGLIETKALKTLLRDSGLSRKEVDALFNGGFTGLKNLRNAEEQEEKQAEQSQTLANFLSEVSAKL